MKALTRRAGVTSKAGLRAGAPADESGGDAPGPKEMPGPPVHDDLGGDPEPVELPSRQAGALQAWPGLIHQNVNALSFLVGRPDDAQRRPVVYRRQRTRVAVVDDGVALVEQGSAVPADPPVDLDIFIGQLLRLLQHPKPHGLRPATP